MASFINFRRFTTLLLLACSFNVSFAQSEFDRYPFASSQQEQRFNAITKEMRCTVCQNQTVYDSMAPLALDLREQIYLMVESGKTDTEIIEFMTYRYGDYIFYRPPVKLNTLVLWFGPGIMLLIGMTFIARRVKNQSNR